MSEAYEGMREEETVPPATNPLPGPREGAGCCTDTVDDSTGRDEAVEAGTITTGAAAVCDGAGAGGGVGAGVGAAEAVGVGAANTELPPRGTEEMTCCCCCCCCICN